MRISDWSSDVCSSDLRVAAAVFKPPQEIAANQLDFIAAEELKGAGVLDQRRRVIDAVAGTHERNCNSRAARFPGPHRATCSQTLDIVASVLSSRWVSKSIAPTSGAAQGDLRAETSFYAVAINQDAPPRSQTD